MDVFKPFIHERLVSLSSDMSDSTPVTILRDTGVLQSLLLSDTLLFSKQSSVGGSVLSGESIVLSTVQCRFIPFTWSQALCPGQSKLEYSCRYLLSECILF